MDLNKIRSDIDLIDSKILKLLNQRMELVIMAGRLKGEVEDPQREAEVLARVEADTPTLLDKEFVRALFKEVIKESKRLQKGSYRPIAFQGEHGAFGELAALAWRQDLVPIPCPQFEDVFEGVRSGLYDYGVVPVENSLGGPISEVNRLLLETDLLVIGAVDMAVRLCLLALPDMDYREIRRAYSHPQALAQARSFLRRNKLEPVSFYDTAGAARMLSEKRPEGAAAIASKLCASLYGLEIIKENIEAPANNRTRFLVLSKEEGCETPAKCSIVFSTQHKAGTLFRVLELFAREGLNLTRIESFPTEPGSFAFFLDFEMSQDKSKVHEVLNRARKITTFLKPLGYYKEVRVE